MIFEDDPTVFNPEYLHQVFNEDETIFGYLDLKIYIYFI